MRVFAIVTGGSYWAPSNGAESIEVHESMRAAVESFRERDMANGRWPVTVSFADGHESSDFYPTWDASLVLYAAEWNDDVSDMASAAEEAIGLGYPDAIVSFGPRGGIRLERC